MNAILGERLSIISPKAQTTRGRLNGIINEEDAQIIFSDTPGYINQPAYELHKSMNHFVHEAFEDADVIMLITDKFQSDDEQQFLIDQCNKTKLPVVVVMNKVDLCKPEELNKHEEKWNKLIPNSRFIAISARENFNTTNLISLVKDFLPESEAYFDKDVLTDRNLRFFVGEIVREKIFLQYEKEIPYSCEVIVEEYKELETMDRIRCIIYVERDSQKNIVIGSGGKAINKLGTEARKEIEAFLDKKIFLDLFVKVRDGWRNNELDLKKFGYKG
jgi:GTP-binding protein Era